MSSIPPPPRTSALLAIVVALGGAGGYGLAHMPVNVPWWVSLSLGCVFTAWVSVGWYYKQPPTQRTDEEPPPTPRNPGVP